MSKGDGLYTGPCAVGGLVPDRAFRKLGCTKCILGFPPLLLGPKMNKIPEGLLKKMLGPRVGPEMLGPRVGPKIIRGFCIGTKEIGAIIQDPL